MVAPRLANIMCHAYMSSLCAGSPVHEEHADGCIQKGKCMVARAAHTPCAPHTHSFCISQKNWCTWNITSRMHRCRGVGHSAVHSSMCAAACTMHRACTIKGLLSTSNIRGAAKIKKKLREFRGIKTKRVSDVSGAHAACGRERGGGACPSPSSSSGASPLECAATAAPASSAPLSADCAGATPPSPLPPLVL